MTRDETGPAFWSSVSAHTGDVITVRQAERGNRSDLTAVAECEAGSFFVKAVRNVPGGRRDSIERERLINPHVRSVSPALRWYVDEGEWYVLGFDVIEGRCSEFDPGSPDLPAVVRLLNRVAAIPTPDLALAWPDTRWSWFADSEEEAKLFEGGALLHTDIHPSNILVGSRGTSVVDWAWPTTGAAFIDPACLVVQLIAAGHSAQDAESWGAQCRAWETASPQTLDAFVVAMYRMYRRYVRKHPDEGWMREMVDAARKWAEHRRVWD